MTTIRDYLKTLSDEALEELVEEGERWMDQGSLPEGCALEVEYRRATGTDNPRRQVMSLTIFSFECWRELALRRSPSSRDLQAAVAAWREAKVLSAEWMLPTETAIISKLFEEGGEFARAVVGRIENRPGRGDPLQEAAQTIIVLLAYFGIHDPKADLYAAVRAEMKRLGA